MTSQKPRACLLPEDQKPQSTLYLAIRTINSTDGKCCRSKYRGRMPVDLTFLPHS
jgi:hypothetical protein